MKKSLFMLSAVALALASCSSEDTMDLNSGSSIKFRTIVENNGRAGVTYKENLNEFFVTAHGSGEYYQNMFTNLKVTSTDNGKTWTPQREHYWPAWNLQFVAYSPAALKENVSIMSEQRKIMDFKPQAWTKNQFDGVVCATEGSRSKNETTGVPLTFNHIFSAIHVKAINKNTARKVVVMGVRLTDIKSGSTFDFPTSENKISPNAWGAPSTRVSYVSENKANYPLSATAKDIMPVGDNFMVIPQQLTAWTGDKDDLNARISVKVRLYNVNDEGKEMLYSPDPKDPTAGCWVSVPIGNKWEAGKLYTYTLDFTEGAGIIDNDQKIPDPSVEPNTGDPDKDPFIEDGKKPKDETGKEIPGGEKIDKAITYTVTVNPFVGSGNKLDM